MSKLKGNKTLIKKSRKKKEIKKKTIAQIQKTKKCNLQILLVERE
jgi:hypothetical protein